MTTPATPPTPSTPPVAPKGFNYQAYLAPAAFFIGISMALYSVGNWFKGEIPKSDINTSQHLLVSLGYTQIQMLTTDDASCTDGEVNQNRFRAVTPNGNKVSGTVCGTEAGSFTIRFFANPLK